MSMLYKVGGRRKFTSWAELSAWLTAAGSSYDGEAALVNKTTGLTIGRWAYVDSAITSIGPVRFDRVSATPTGAAASVAGAVVTVTAPHTLATLSKTLRVQIVTDGTWSDVASGQWSVSGNDVTVPAATASAIAAALGAGKTCRLHVEGVSELDIGGSSCALQPAAGFVTYFTGSGVFQAVPGASAARCVLPVTPTQGMRVVHGAPTVGSSAGDRVTWGVLSGAVYAFGGFGEDAAGDARVILTRSVGANVYSVSSAIVYADQTGVDLIIGSNRAVFNSVGIATSVAVAAGTASSSIGRIDPATALVVAELQAASVVLTRIYQ